MEGLRQGHGKDYKAGSDAGRNKLEGVPALRFAKHAEKFLGRELIDAYQLMADELSEPEALLTANVVTVDELIKYLGEIGFFEHYPDDVEYFTSLLGASRKRIMPSLTREYGEDKAILKYTDGINSSLTFNRQHRPLFHLLIGDIRNFNQRKRQFSILAEAHADQDALKKVESNPLYIEQTMVISACKIAKKQNRLEKEPNLQKTMLLARQMECLSKEKTTEFTEQKVIETDQMVEVILEQDAKPGIYDISIKRGPYYIQSFKLLIPPEDSGSLMWGKFRLSLRDIYKGEPYFVEFILSPFSKDFCLDESILAELKTVFEHYGVPMEYQAFRRKLVKAIWTAFEEKAILVKQKTVVRDIDSLEQALISQTSSEENPSEEEVDGPETDLVISQDEVGEEPESTSIFSESIKVERKRFSNLAYDQVLNAFRSMGIEVRFGGRHPKLVRLVDGSERSVPFVNRHKKSFHYMARIIKGVLKILGLDEQEFLASLK